MTSDTRKNMLQFSNIAHSQDQTRKLGLKHVRDKLVNGSEVDKRSKINTKLKSKLLLNKKFPNIGEKNFKHNKNHYNLSAPFAWIF